MSVWNRVPLKDVTVKDLKEELKAQKIWEMQRYGRSSILISGTKGDLFRRLAELDKYPLTYAIISKIQPVEEEESSEEEEEKELVETKGQIIFDSTKFTLVDSQYRSYRSNFPYVVHIGERFECMLIDLTVEPSERWILPYRIYLQINYNGKWRLEDKDWGRLAYTFRTQLDNTYHSNDVAYFTFEDNKWINIIFSDPYGNPIIFPPDSHWTIITSVKPIP